MSDYDWLVNTQTSPSHLSYHFSAEDISYLRNRSPKSEQGYHVSVIAHKAGENCFTHMRGYVRRHSTGFCSRFKVSFITAATSQYGVIEQIKLDPGEYLVHWDNELEVFILEKGELMQKPSES